MGPVTENLGMRLTQTNRRRISADWKKAARRLEEDDPDGAITAARSLLETTCKCVLDETGVVYDTRADLPKLYGLAAARLGIAAGLQTDRLFKSVFGAAHTVVNSVAELRNKLGDAHGKGLGALNASRSHAALAVNLAGSIAFFLLDVLDSHLAATRRLTADGAAILKFDKSMVWRLIDHARNSPSHSKRIGQRKAKPELWLVGDAGIYLMSNGRPPISILGKTMKSMKPGGKSTIPLLTAFAEGCDPTINELEDWWPIHNSICGGDDFVLPVNLTVAEYALEGAEHQIVITVNADEYMTVGDLEYGGS